jgi:uncharacterized protein YecE (DUF72 family)
MAVWIGTSGWQYAHWRQRFYPRGVPQSAWLEFFAERFATVESNNAFYRLPEAHTFEAWARRTPDDFVMAVKASRYLTHIRRLREPEQPVRLFLERATRLGSKLGPVLLQLPPTLQIDVERLDNVLTLFPASVRVAVEFRHQTWYVEDVRAVLERHGAALCLADRRGPVTPIWRTADWSYLRFHGGRASPPSCYGERALAGWAERLAAAWRPDENAYVYFNNDHAACALRDAIAFAGAAAGVGLKPTRVGDPAEVRVGPV